MWHRAARNCGNRTLTPGEVDMAGYGLMIDEGEIDKFGARR